MKSLTEKQSNIYKFISEWNVTKGYPPTQAEIRDHFGFRSINAVRSHLVLIEKKGYIRLICGKARGIKLSQLPAPAIRHRVDSIPLLGRIAAGVPIWAEQNFEEYLPCHPDLFGGGELFALHIYGDSMVGAGIIDGDIAVIQKKDHVENGDIAAVLIDREATLKRVYLSSEKLVLKADNPIYEDLEYIVDNSNFIRIIGCFQGIIRTEHYRCNS